MPFIFFFFNDTATTEIYTLSLHDALPIFATNFFRHQSGQRKRRDERHGFVAPDAFGQSQFGNRGSRSEEHTSELQSPCNLVCRLLLEKKKELHAGIRHHDRPSSLHSIRIG